MYIKKTGGSPDPFAMDGIGGRNRAASAGQSKKPEAFADVLRQADFGKKDRVEISQRAENDVSAVSRAKSRIKSFFTQDTDASRLESLKSSIFGGNYEINPSEMAQIMLTDE